MGACWAMRLWRGGSRAIAPHAAGAVPQSKVCSLRFSDGEEAPIFRFVNAVLQLTNQRAGEDGGDGGGAERKSDQTLRDSPSAAMRTTTLLTFPHCSVVSQLTDEELEKMRATKAALSALIQRVAKVRQELEETLDDDQDMLVRIIDLDCHLPHSDH